MRWGGLALPSGSGRPLVRRAMNRSERRQLEQELRRLVRRNGRRQGRSDRVFKGDRTDEREVPHDLGNWFTFTNLSGPELDEADLQGRRRMSEQMKALPEGAGAEGGPGCERAGPPETRAELDAKTMEWAARVVFEMNVRPLGEGSGSGDSSATGSSDSTSPLSSPEPIESIL